MAKLGGPCMFFRRAETKQNKIGLIISKENYIAKEPEKSIRLGFLMFVPQRDKIHNLVFE